MATNVAESEDCFVVVVMGVCLMTARRRSYG
jgi:hypothetical protein